MFRWTVLILLIALIVGSISAFFLATLSWATSAREANLWLIAFLPLGGLCISLGYLKWGKNVAKGNNVILEEYSHPRRKIDWVMAPLVYVGTILTHLLGGSAGREGTAVQMGASIADQFSPKWLAGEKERRLLLTLGVSAGFSAVFGTPLTGAVFSLEVNGYHQFKLQHFIPALIAALLSYIVCSFFPIAHTHYPEIAGPRIDLYLCLVLLLLGGASGLMSYFFVLFTRIWAILFRQIKTLYWRPVIGGVVIALVTYLCGTYEYIGLGIPTILDSFENPQHWYDSIVKVVYTTFTLGAGFKGGEVTPLFFIGATLGNTFSNFCVLPLDFLAGLGFVAVFSGATNTPLACAVMAAEVFGVEMFPYALLANYMAYLISGPKGIYTSQKVDRIKYWPYYLKRKLKRLKEGSTKS